MTDITESGLLSDRVTDNFYTWVDNDVIVSCLSMPAVLVAMM